jgi:tetratricopeptide (TPR) repeat protein
MKSGRKVSVLLTLAFLISANVLPAFALDVPPPQWQQWQQIELLDPEDTEIALRAALLLTKEKEQQLLIIQALSDLCHEQKRYEEERDFLLSWISLAQQVQPFPAVNCATQNLRLSYAYFVLKDYEKAETAAKTSLQMFKQSCSESSPNVALALNNLAWVQMKLNKSADAEANILEALAILKVVAGEKSMIYGLLSENLAVLYEQTNNREAAIRLYKNSLRILKKFLDKEDSIIVDLRQHIEEQSSLLAASKGHSEKKKLARHKETQK